VGLAAFLLSASRVNHGLIDSSLSPGPGLTIDESINVRQGNYLSDAILQHGPMMFVPGDPNNVYAPPGYLPDHPPLARIVLGTAHTLAAGLISGSENTVANVPSARLGSSFGLGMTVALLVLFVQRRYDAATAVAAGMILMLMPRVIGHSRIASLETLTTLAWFAALVPLLAWWTHERPPTVKQSLISGAFWGLLMLTKIQGVMLPPVILLWVLYQFRHRAFVPLALWGLAGTVVFFAGWPWLWLDPIENTKSYFVKASDRSVVHCWYMSQQLKHNEVPWHYVPVILLSTIPLHATAGMILRGVQKRLDAAEWLLVLSVVIPLAVFARPATPVYDGTRLFLFVMPAIAILAARGLVTVTQAWNSGRMKRLAIALVGLLLMADVAWTVSQTGPYAADAYCAAIPQSESVDPFFEACYWGDGMNGEFWKQVPEDATVYVAPVLHDVYLPDMQLMIPQVRERRIRLEPFYYDPEKQRGLVLLIHRLASLKPQLRTVPPGATVVAESRLGDTVLARVVDTTNGTWPELNEW